MNDLTAPRLSFPRHADGGCTLDNVSIGYDEFAFDYDTAALRDNLALKVNGFNNYDGR